MNFLDFFKLEKKQAFFIRNFFSEIYFFKCHDKNTSVKEGLDFMLHETYKRVILLFKNYYIISY